MKRLGKLSFAAAAASLVMISCNQNAQNNTVDTKAETATAQNADAMKIAYVEVDSIMTQYEFCKEFSKILEKKGQNIDATVNKKQQSLQNAAAKFEQDIRANKYTQQQAESVQANLQKQGYDLQMLQQKLTSEFVKEQQKYDAALRDSIHNFLNVYNKDKKYSLILSKAGDNILFADKAYDITDEVIKGLNKAYKPVKK